MSKKVFHVITGKKIIIALLVFNLLLPAWANAYQVVGKTTSEEIITEGVVLQTVRLKTSEGPLNIYILKADLTSPYLKVDTLVGQEGSLDKNQSVTAMARRAGAVAAINGDFFQMKESGRPIGLLYQGGRLLESPAMRNDMFGFGIDKEQKPILEVFSFSGEVVAGNGKSYPLAGINKPEYLLISGASSDTDALHIYDSSWGSISRGTLQENNGVVEAVVRRGAIERVLTGQPGVAIPPDGYIIRGHGEASSFILENLTVGVKVNYNFKVYPEGEKLFAALGGQALLVENGRIPGSFTQNIGGNNARTAVGVSRDGKDLFLVVVERQVASDGTLISRGMTQEELASFLVSQNIWRAVNLDGGGSTTMAARTLGDFEANLVNQPQGAVQRLVPNSIGLFSTAPQGTLKGLLVKGPALMLTGDSAEFIVRGYDQYYNPVRITPNTINWSTSPSNGQFTGNIFIPSKGGSVLVSASMGDIKGTATVNVIGPESLSTLEVKPAAITIQPGKSVKMTVRVTTIFGEYIDLKAGAVKWSVEPTLGTLSNDTFTAGSKTASGQLKGSFQGLNISVPVTIEMPGVELQAIPGQDTAVVLDKKVKVQVSAGSIDSAAKIKLSYSDIPDNLPPGFVPLGAISVNPVTGQKPGLNTPWRLSWEYNSNAVNGRQTILMWDNSQDKWIEQPGLARGDNTLRTAFALVWGFGKLVLADDLRPEKAFKDTGKHWAGPAIHSLAARGVIKGFPDGTYGPDKKVTRAQFVLLLAAALQWPEPESAPVFKDSIPDWARPAVAAAVTRGVATGYPDGSFAPNALITRAEMAVMISRAVNLDESEAKLLYADTGTIPPFARNAVEKVTGSGLMQGSEGKFRPRDGATRAETAIAVTRLMDWWVKQLVATQN